jgi:hypothetical protein
MKRLILFLLFLTVGKVVGQTNDHIQFDYDTAGNQIKRYVIDIEGRQTNPDAVPVTAIAEEDLIKADIYDDVKYYPNPVREELYVSWVTTRENYVTAIELYNLSGQLIYRLPNLQNEVSTTLNFGNCAQGLYTVSMNYSNGSKKTLKVMKH